MHNAFLKNGPPGKGTLEVATFYVGNFLLAIEVIRVQEVLRSQKMTVVPLAPPIIEGLINLRGQIVPALNMRRRLCLDPAAGSPSPMNVIVRTDEGAVSLMVDEIGDVLALEQENIEPPPKNLAPHIRGILQAVYKLHNSLLLLLDTDQTINVGLAAQ